MYSIEGLWIGMVPSALFCSNFSVLKALLADYHEVLEQTDDIKKGQSQTDSDDSKNCDVSDKGSNTTGSMSNVSHERTNSMGKLGMSFGLAIMIGPMCAAAFLNNFDSSVYIAGILTAISSAFVTLIPPVLLHPCGKTHAHNLAKQSSLQILKRLSSNKGVLFLMCIRICMTVAFHIFHIIWTPSLRRRFNFGPSDHGYFMSFVGLSYALSQGYGAKRILQSLSTPQQRPKILIVSAVILGLGRWYAFHTHSLVAVYAIFFVMITALGVVNTIVSADASSLVPSYELGSLFGLLESVESAAGIVGPVLGGALSNLWVEDTVTAPLYAVVGMYALVCVMVSYGYEKHVLCAKSRQL